MSWAEIEVSGRKCRVAIVRSGDAVWVSWSGMQRRIAPESSVAEVARGVERELRAPMTGRVAKVAVAVGAKVAAGQTLIVLEAMKMEYRIAAPRDGIVESVGCRDGDRVDLGHLLVALAP
jgi:acetyl/propionyl-CoA carboxylase alpha subunit